jgi:hypothetical protein
MPHGMRLRMPVQQQQWCATAAQARAQTARRAGYINRLETFKEHRKVPIFYSLLDNSYFESAAIPFKK